MLNTQTPTAGTPTTDNGKNAVSQATPYDHTPTPAMLHAHEQRHLLCEVKYAMAQIDDVFSVCLNYPINAGEQQTLYYMAWNRLAYAQKMLGKLDELLQGGKQ